MDFVRNDYFLNLFSPCNSSCCCPPSPHDVLSLGKFSLVTYFSLHNQRIAITVIIQDTDLSTADYLMLLLEEALNDKSSPRLPATLVTANMACLFLMGNGSPCTTRMSGNHTIHLLEPWPPSPDIQRTVDHPPTHLQFLEPPTPSDFMENEILE